MRHNDKTDYILKAPRLAHKGKSMTKQWTL